MLGTVFDTLHQKDEQRGVLLLAAKMMYPSITREGLHDKFLWMALLNYLYRKVNAINGGSRPIDFRFESLAEAVEHFAGKV